MYYVHVWQMWHLYEYDKTTELTLENGCSINCYFAAFRERLLTNKDSLKNHDELNLK